MLIDLPWAVCGLTATDWKALGADVLRDDGRSPWHLAAMVASLFQDVPFKAKAIGWGIIVIPLATLALLGAMFLRPQPIDQRLVWGCYVSDNAPALVVEAGKILILDGQGRSLSYIAEPYKAGFRLTVQPALRLRPSAEGRYHFEQGPGIGYFWPLLAADSDNPREVRIPGDFGGRLSLIAADGTPIIYVRSSDRDGCR